MRIDKISLNHVYKPRTPVVACIGFFDGVHRGHKALISKTIEMAKGIGAATGLITFEPDPWVTIKGIPASQLEHLTTTRQKINIISSLGIQNVYLLDFTPEMAALTPEEFAARVLGQLNLKGLVCGFDFHFGAGGAGGAAMLGSLAGCPAEVISAVEMDGEKISSSRIVKAVKDGDFFTAYQLLGHPFTMDGRIRSGSHIGATLGFPTANVEFSEEYVIPRIGVYSAHVSIGGKRYGAMVNVGHNPTLNYQEQVSIECHILNHDGNFYGEQISVMFEQYIREERKFQNRENLIMQLESDRQKVRKALGL